MIDINTHQGHLNAVGVACVAVYMNNQMQKKAYLEPVFKLIFQSNK